MKNAILSLVTTLAINAVALPVFACTLSPLGDNRLRIEALLNALDEMETMQELKSAVNEDVFQVTVFNQSTLKSDKRIYQLINTSAMCPIYTAREIK